MEPQVAIALAALIVSIGNAMWQGWTARQGGQTEREQALRQQQLEEEQGRMQQTLTEIERQRYEDEQRRKKEARVIVRSQIIPNTRAELWLIVENQSEVAAHNVNVELKRIEDKFGTGEARVHLRSVDELPIVALGPGQPYPLRVRFSGFAVFTAIVTWDDDAGKHSAEFQVADTGRFE